MAPGVVVSGNANPRMLNAFLSRMPGESCFDGDVDREILHHAPGTDSTQTGIHPTSRREPGTRHSGSCAIPTPNERGSQRAVRKSAGHQTDRVTSTSSVSARAIGRCRPRTRTPAAPRRYFAPRNGIRRGGQRSDDGHSPGRGCCQDWRRRGNPGRPEAAVAGQRRGPPAERHGRGRRCSALRAEYGNGLDSDRGRYGGDTEGQER